MNEIEKRIEEVKKGCGKCGQMEDLKHSWNILLCQTCQAKLDTLTFCEEVIKRDKLDLDDYDAGFNDGVKRTQEDLKKKIEKLKRKILNKKTFKGRVIGHQFNWIIREIDTIFGNEGDNRGKEE